jgi:hypothetical protein
VYLSDVERAELDAACSTMVGLLDRLQARAPSEVFDSGVSSAQFAREAQRLSQAVSSFYEMTMREHDADEDDLSADLGEEINAEHFGHQPPNRVKNQS